MGTYVVRRLIGLVPQLLLLLALIVVLVRLAPGNTIDAMVGDQGKLTAQARHNLEHSLGLDQPVWEQFGRYAWSVLHGDLGTSVFLKRPVRTLVMERAGATLELAGAAVVLSVVVAVTAGVAAGLSRGSPLDYVIRVLAVLGLGIPNFVLAASIIVLPALWFHARPPLYAPWTRGVGTHVQSMLLPVLSISVVFMAALVRMARSSIIQVMNQDYIRTARAKGLRQRRIWIVHGLKNALLPTVSLIGLEVASLIGGAVIVEQVFSIPGLGTVLFTALGQRDYPVIQGVTLLVGAVVVLVNVLVDVTYTWLDPRIRFAG